MASARTMTMLRSALSAIGLAALLGGPALAQSYGDIATGLSVSPPAPFVASAGRPHPLFDTTIDINAKTGTPKTVSDGRLCVLGFRPSAQNAELTRDLVNVQMAKPEWQGQYRTLFETVGTVSELKTFEHQGFLGVELIVTPKALPDETMFVSIMETPKGRTGLLCATNKAGFTAALPQFRALRATMHAPE